VNLEQTRAEAACMRDKMRRLYKDELTRLRVELKQQQEEVDF
jgi:hypothetical protein